ncbi:MAG: AsmA family protein [Candidatus Omnitrophica bacterium]|nr:AsmA family protein [Candidatus Omnitrophota bacterium]
MAKKKRVLIYLAAFILLVVGSLFYLNKFYLPVKLRALLISGIEDATTLSARVGSLEYNIIRGFVIKNIGLSEKGANEEVFSCEDISFNLLVLPIFKQKKIIIPSIKINKPRLSAAIDQAGQLNITRFLKPAKTDKPAFSLMIGGINIADGEVVFRDKRFDPEYKKEINEINLKASLDLPAKIDLRLSAAMARGQVTSKLNLKGQFLIAKKQGNADITLSDLPLSEIKEYFRIIPAEISGVSPLIKASLKFSQDKLNITAEIPLKDARVKYNEIEVTANWLLKPDISLPLKGGATSYKGSIALEDTRVSGIPRIGEIQSIKGALTFDRNLVAYENIVLRVKEIPFLINGKAKLGFPPYIELTASADTDAGTLLKALKDAAGEIPLDVTGKIAFSANVSGALSGDMPLKYDGRLAISEAECGLKALPEPLKNVNAVVEFSKDTLSWKQAGFTYEEMRFTSEGALTDFARPLIDFTLNNNELAIKSKLEIIGKQITVNSFNASYFDSILNASGVITTADTSSPFLDMGLAAEINLENLGSAPLPQQVKDAIGRIKPVGLLKIEGTLKGQAADYKNWQVDAGISSPRISLYGVSLNTLSSNISQSNRLLKVNANSSLYAGALNLEGAVNFAAETPVHSLNAGITRADISLLENDFPKLKGKDYAGTLNASLSLNGRGADMAQLQGDGIVSIIEGKIWELNLLKGLGNFIFVPAFQNIVFSEGGASFILRDGFVRTEDLALSSDSLHLQGKGSIGFDSSLDFTLEAIMSEGLLKETGDIRKITTAIFGGPGITIKISGTVKEPKYSLKSAVMDPIKNIKNITDLIFGK